MWKAASKKSMPTNEGPPHHDHLDSDQGPRKPAPGPPRDWRNGLGWRCRLGLCLHCGDGCYLIANYPEKCGRTPSSPPKGAMAGKKASKKGPNHRPATSASLALETMDLENEESTVEALGSEASSAYAA
uniref:Uncharacterized protein n=1 Tax=Sphaerodactylus townsendi TaxID=933632 RepID=A0ACB8ENJ3_9SAUR